MVLSGTGARPQFPDPLQPEYTRGSFAPNKKGRKFVTAPKMLVPPPQHRVALIHHRGTVSPCSKGSDLLCRTGATAGLARSSRCRGRVVGSFWRPHDDPGAAFAGCPATSLYDSTP